MAVHIIDEFLSTGARQHGTSSNLAMMRLPRKAGWLLLALCVAALPSTQSGVADADDGLLTLQRDTKSRLRVLCAHCTYACRYLEMWEAANQTLLAADRIKGCSRPDELKGPEFMLIGAQKSGSTDIFERLREHTETFRLSSEMSHKEMHFFDWQCLGPMLGRDRLQDSVHRRKLDLPSSTQWCDATHYAASLTEFRQLNPAKGRTWGAGAPLATAPLVGAPATGEATVNYLFYPEVPAMTKACFPTTKLVAMLRSPVDRAHSGFFQHVRNQQGSFTESVVFEAGIIARCEALVGRAIRNNGANLFIDCAYPLFVVGVLEATMAKGGPWERHAEYKQSPRQCNNAFIRWRSHLLRGLYYFQIHAWLQHFPATQMLVLKSEDYFADPEAVVATITDFIHDRGHGDRHASLTTSDGAAAPLFANSKAKGQVPESTRAQLSELYRPYDELLTALLRQHGIPWESWPSK